MARMVTVIIIKSFCFLIFQFVFVPLSLRAPGTRKVGLGGQVGGSTPLQWTGNPFADSKCVTKQDGCSLMMMRVGLSQHCHHSRTTALANHHQNPNELRGRRLVTLNYLLFSLIPPVLLTGQLLLTTGGQGSCNDTIDYITAPITEPH